MTFVMAPENLEHVNMISLICVEDIIICNATEISEIFRALWGSECICAENEDRSHGLFYDMK